MAPLNKNESGISSIPCLLAIIITLGSSMIFLKILKKENLTTLNHAKSYLCIKRYNKQLNSHIKIISQLNFLIRNIKLIKLIASAVGLPIKALTELGSSGILSILKTMEWIEVLKFQKSISTNYLNGCPYPFTLLFSPYSKMGIKVRRMPDGSAKLKSSKWNSIFHLPKRRIIRIDYQVKGGQLDIKSNVLF